ncbi:MAG: hypothetical protein ACE5RL_06400 [Nitrosarchaeum sp.]
MKKQFMGALAAILVLTIVFSSVQHTNAVPYSGYDGSISKHLEKVTVKQYPGKSDYWVYIVKACATSYPLAVTEVILKSDMERQNLGVNKVIQKGECSHYGVVMKAKNGNTLGAELVQKHEAVEKMQQILKDAKNKSSSQRSNMMDELLRLYTITGLMPRG